MVACRYSEDVVVNDLHTRALVDVVVARAWISGLWNRRCKLFVCWCLSRSCNSNH